MTNPTPHPVQIVQHNAITSGRFSLKACQLDIFFMLLSLLRKDDPVDRAYRIHLKDIEKISERKWNYQQLREATSDMGSHMFEIETSDIYIQLWMFKWFKYEKNKGFIDVCINPDLRPYLFDLKENFTKMRLKSVLACSSKYAKRLYAICCQWRAVGSVTFPLTQLKEMLGLKDPYGKKMEKFRQIGQLQASVLDIAKKQINENTDIYIDYELIKEGRSYEIIKFNIGGKKSISESKKEQPHPLEKYIHSMVEFGIGSKVATKLCEENKYKEFAEIALAIEKNPARYKKVKDKAAYVMGILKNKEIIV